MKRMKFIRLDADGIGDAIELALLSGNFKEAQEIHFLIQNELKSTMEIIKQISSSKILMFGSDDILFTIDNEIFEIEILEEIQKSFWHSTNYSLSIGVGDTIRKAMLNLRKAKLLGKNRIESEK